MIPLTANLKGPANGPFAHVDELAFGARIAPLALMERMLPFVTVFSGRAEVNVLEASPGVLSAIPGMTKDRIDAILAQRNLASDNQALQKLLGCVKPNSWPRLNRPARHGPRLELLTITAEDLARRQ